MSEIKRSPKLRKITRRTAKIAGAGALISIGPVMQLISNHFNNEAPTSVNGLAPITPYGSPNSDGSKVPGSRTNIPEQSNKHEDKREALSQMLDGIYGSLKKNADSNLLKPASTGQPGFSLSHSSANIEGYDQGGSVTTLMANVSKYGKFPAISYIIQETIPFTPKGSVPAEESVMPYTSMSIQVYKGTTQIQTNSGNAVIPPSKNLLYDFSMAKNSTGNWTVTERLTDRVPISFGTDSHDLVNESMVRECYATANNALTDASNQISIFGIDSATNHQID
jgi:hypothetical protein